MGLSKVGTDFTTIANPPWVWDDGSVLQVGARCTCMCCATRTSRGAGQAC
jgi:hypothetical protein